ncbi:MAG: hypothetical protein Kow00108_14770 [Calditrichia bacterium]
MTIPKVYVSCELIEIRIIDFAASEIAIKTKKDSTREKTIEAKKLLKKINMIVSIIKSEFLLINRFSSNK